MLLADNNTLNWILFSFRINAFWFLFVFVAMIFWVVRLLEMEIISNRNTENVRFFVTEVFKNIPSQSYPPKYPQNFISPIITAIDNKWVMTLDTVETNFTNIGIPHDKEMGWKLRINANVLLQFFVSLFFLFSFHFIAETLPPFTFVFVLFLVSSLLCGANTFRIEA